MAGTETITLRLVAQDLMSGNVSKAVAGLDRLAKRGGLVGSVLQGVGQSMGQLINPVALVANGIGMVTDALGDAQTAYREDQASQAKLKAALEANIEAWDGNTQAIEDTIEARMKLGFSDDEQRASLALLVAQVKDVSDALAIQRTAMDLARLKGVSLSDSATLLAKAYNGSATGLQRMGVQLTKGARGMSALGEVQRRVAGQAQTWAETSTGAAEAFNVKVGEMQEKIGEFVDGASHQFIGFLSGVVDVIDGPDGAERALHDVATEIYRMNTAATQAAGTETPFARLAADLQKWTDTLNLSEGAVDMRTFDWIKQLGPDTLRNFGPASIDLVARIAEVAHAVQETGGDFGDFARVLREELGPAANVVTSTWGTVAETVEESGDKIVHTAGRIRAVPFQMLRSLTDVKAEWKASWKNLAEWAKHPFRPEAFEKYINKQTKKALENANDPDLQKKVRRNWQRVADAMESPILKSLVNMGMSLDEAIAKIMEVQRLAKRVDPLAIVVTGAGGGQAGGSGTGGTRYSLPSDRSSPSRTNVNVNVTHIGSMSESDGQRMARALGPHISRELGRAGR
jgi:hypothetical protein